MASVFVRGVVLVGSLLVSIACAPARPDQSTANQTRGNQDNVPWFSNVGAGVPEFWVRPGYKVTLVASDLRNSRFMCFDGKGDLFLSRPDQGDILTLRAKGDRYEQVATFASPGKSVHGLCYKDGWLWFTLSGSVHKGRDSNGDGKADELVTVLDGLPSGGHWWRAITVVDDGFFTSIGCSGNIEEDLGTDRMRLWKYSLDGKNRELWCSGIRNTEKYLFRPGTTELYGADQGSDWFGGPLGDKQGRQPITDWNPPCEFNLYEKGNFYGHPYIVGNRVPRIEFQNRKDIIELAEKTTPPIWCFGAHWAPDGWTFLTKNGLGEGWARDAVVAMHGSWNSLKPTGYRLERVMYDSVTGKPFGSQPLVVTLNRAGRVVGRPVDVVEEPSGSILFTDDMNHAIYRVSRVK